MTQPSAKISRTPNDVNSYIKTKRYKGDSRTIDRGTPDLGQAHVKSNQVKLNPAYKGWLTY